MSPRARPEGEGASRQGCGSGEQRGGWIQGLRSGHRWEPRTLDQALGLECREHAELHMGVEGGESGSQQAMVRGLGCISAALGTGESTIFERTLRVGRRLCWRGGAKGSHSGFLGG